MSVEIARHGPEAIGELRPLWLALVHHHGETVPSMGPLRDDADSWARRRAYYEQELAQPEAFALVARENGRAVAYALVAPRPGSPTWPQPDGWFEIESLAVLPEARGRGLGHRLIGRVQEEVGDAELRLYVMAENAGARRFYAREGFEDTIVVLRRTGPGAGR